MKKFYKIGLGLLVALLLGFGLGPRVSFDKVNNTPITSDIPLSEIEKHVTISEQGYKVKPGNHAKVIWADSTRKTDFAFVYLHGFSASLGEGETIMSNLIKRYKYNAYLSRLSEHGLVDVEAMESLTPTSWVESAKEAIAIGKVIGKKVIIISTSTGGTLASYLAAGDPDISHLVMMSPNFELYDTNSKLMMMPWGKQILKYMMKGNYHYWNIEDTYVKTYWNTKKRIEALIALRDLLDQTMTTETFHKITIPYFIGYYYKDEEHKDKVISIEAIKEFHELSATPADRKILMAFPDAEGHVIGCRHLNSNWKNVQSEIFDFLNDNLERQ